MFLKRSFVLGVLWFACGVVFLLRALLGGGVVSIPLLLLVAVCLGGGAAECVLSVRCGQAAALALLILLAAQFSFCALFALSIIFTSGYGASVIWMTALCAAPLLALSGSAIRLLHRRFFAKQSPKD